MGDLTAGDASALAAAIGARTVSCVELMGDTLARIGRLNPRVNAIVALRDGEALLREAALRDAELARGASRGWLHGMPLAVKDLEPVAGIRSTSGSPILADFVPEADSIMVTRLRAAGAVVIGKTNVPEWGLGSQTYNPVYGTTLNAFDQARTAGGSSGGAAVALALRLLPVADGSDYGGSLRNPAAWNNVFGLRPTIGRVPAEAPDVFLPWLGVLGPMARTIPDLARLLAIQAGYDPRAPFSLTEDPAPFVVPLERDVAGTRLAWLGDLGGALACEPGVLELCAGALAAFEQLGCVVEPLTPRFDPERLWQDFVTLRAWQVAARLGEHYRDPTRRTLLKQEAVWEVERGLALRAAEVSAASVGRTAWYDVVLRLFERFDALVLPGSQVFPFAAAEHWPRSIAGRDMDSYHRWMQVMAPATMAGLPALAVPAGFDARGLPMGVQVLGRPRGERALLELGHAYDRATRWVERRPPPLLAAG